jgi:hypothetical protein
VFNLGSPNIFPTSVRQHVLNGSFGERSAHRARQGTAASGCLGWR